MADELIGQTFGSYTIVEKLGEGGMAAVYKGYQASLNRYVAIKVLRQDLARDQEFVDRFRREALAAARLSHPNVVHVHDAGLALGRYYIIMDFVGGGSLKDLIARGPVGVHRAVALASQVAEALESAHQQGLIHRDVKPANVLLTEDGRPMLTDFGIAKALYESTNLTRTGTTIGTPAYMAPEQFQGGGVDARTDLYALGIVLYEMLTGWSPFNAPTPMVTMYKQINEMPPPMHQMDMTIPDWLDAVVNKALAKRPGDRYQTGTEFAAALRAGRAGVLARDAEATTTGTGRGRPGVAGTGSTGRAVTGDRGATGQTGRGAADNRGATGLTGRGAIDSRGATGPTGRGAIDGRTGTGLTGTARGRQSPVVPLLAAIGVIAVALTVGVILLSGGGGSGKPTPTSRIVIVVAGSSATAEGSDAQTSVPPAVVTAIATETPRPADTDTPRPTATNTPQPTKTPTPRPTDTPLPEDTALPAWRDYIVDHFDANEHDWPTGDSTDEGGYATMDWSISGGKYNWQVQAHKSLHWYVYPAGDALGDQEVSVKVSFPSGKLYRSAGLVFRLVDGDNFYYFALGSDQKVALWLKYGGQWLTLMDWQFCPAARAGQPNVLTVRADSTQISMFVNGESAGQVLDSSLPKGRQAMAIGAEAGDTIDYVFDDFIVRMP